MCLTDYRGYIGVTAASVQTWHTAKASRGLQSLIVVVSWESDPVDLASSSFLFIIVFFLRTSRLCCLVYVFVAVTNSSRRAFSSVAGRSAGEGNGQTITTGARSGPSRAISGRFSYVW